MTADIIHPGHIQSIKWLEQRCDLLIIGLLTDKALKGYKDNVMNYYDRFSILIELTAAREKTIFVVGQNNLNPEHNIKKYKPDAIASGDGWEKEELETIKKYKLKKINIKNNSWKHYSSTGIKIKICQKYC